MWQKKETFIQSMNNSIKKARRKFILLFFLIVILEIFFLAFAIIIIKRVLSGDAHILQIVTRILYVGLGGVFVIANVAYLYKRIYKLIIMEKQEPHYGRIVDFIVERDYSSDKGTFLCHPLIREDASGALYLSCGYYNLSWYKMIYTANGNNPLSVSILRTDNSVVELGSGAVFYILRELKKNVVIKGNVLKIGRDKMIFRHVNEEYSIENMKNVIFYEGAVDVDVE